MSSAAIGVINQASVNYLRLGALGVGIAYGAYRHNSLTHLLAKRQKDAEAHKLDLLFEEGRVAYEASLARAEAEAGAKAGIITDSDSYRFNFDTWQQWSVGLFLELIADEMDKRENALKKAAGKK